VVRQLRTPSIIASALEGVTRAYLALGQTARAVQLLAAASSLRERSGAGVVRSWTTSYEALLASARKQAAAGFDALWDAAARLTASEAAELAIAEGDRMGDVGLS
jgi:hypothetical protein